MLAQSCASKKTSLKAALLDQRVVAGLGNTYVCEALYRSQLSPRRLAATLATKKGEPTDHARRLVGAIHGVLNQAIKAGGSSLRDHRQTAGELGCFRRSCQAFDREGEMPDINAAASSGLHAERPFHLLVPEVPEVRSPLSGDAKQSSGAGALGCFVALLPAMPCAGQCWLRSGAPEGADVPARPIPPVSAGLAGTTSDAGSADARLRLGVQMIRLRPTAGPRISSATTCRQPPIRRLQAGAQRILVVVAHHDKGLGHDLGGIERGLGAQRVFSAGKARCRPDRGLVQDVGERLAPGPDDAERGCGRFDVGDARARRNQAQIGMANR
jgi:hypothetical protein